MPLNTWSEPYYEIDCLDCSVDTYGRGEEMERLAFDHARDCPGHRVQLSRKTHIVIRQGVADDA